MSSIARRVVACAAVVAVALLAQSGRASTALVQVPLVQQGYQYALPVGIDGDVKRRMMVDTGDYAFVSYSPRNVTVNGTRPTLDFCVGLIEDNTPITFYAYNYGNYTCTPPGGRATMSIGSAGAPSNYSVAYVLQNANPELHEWSTCTGDMGMTYGIDSQFDTTFQAIVRNASANLTTSIFGLDFTNPSGPFSLNASESTIQLGALSPTFASEFAWTYQPVQNPMYHNIFIENLTFCGANLFGSYADNWNALIDTGSSCVTLPAEMYDAFFGWLNNETTVSDAFTLPALTFQVSGGNGDLMQIPLSNLLINVSAIDTEPGAPTISTAVGERRICVLRGDSINLEVASTSGATFNNPAPLITFGSMTLRSLYLGVEFNQYGVGLANKLSAEQQQMFIDNVNGQGCKRPQQCIGQQQLDHFTNRCKPPQCHTYFFATIDEHTQTCVYKDGAVVMGLLFVIAFGTIEIVSYFVLQYSAVSLIDTRGSGASTNVQALQRLIGVDAFTLATGKWLAQFVDWLIMNFFSSFINPQNAPVVPGVMMNPQ